MIEPAFPFKCQGPTTAPEIYYGISIRDYFAAKAMQFIGAPNPKTGQYAIPSEFEAIADQAYAMADAMLKAREHGNS